MLNQSVITSPNLDIKQRKWLFLVILILMSTCGLIGSDLYLPTLPDMGIKLSKDPFTMQLTLSIYLLGLSIGQLILGPLTDHYGRKKLLILGMIIYCFASFSCALVSNYSQFLILRFMQALGACSGLIIGRAIVGDLFDAKKSAEIFSTIFPFVGMSPAISPVIGGIIGYYFGWQANFIFISLLSLLIAILIIHYLPETLLTSNRQPINFLKVLSAYCSLCINKKFIAYVSAPCTAYIAYFAYMAESPFIFHANGFDERIMGSFYITLSAAYVLGNIAGKKIINFIDLNRALFCGYTFFNLGGLLLLISCLLKLSVSYLIFSMSVLTFGNGFLIPLGTAGVISSFSKIRGYASGLLGFLQIGSAALSSSLVGLLSYNDSIVGLGTYILITTLFGLLLFLLFIPKNEFSR